MSHTGCFTDGVVEHVAENAGRGCFFGVLTGSAGELEAVRFGVFFGVEHVRAASELEPLCVSIKWAGGLPFAAESEGNLLHVLLALVPGA